VYIDFKWICNQWTHCFKNLQWPPPQPLCYSQMKHLWQVPQNFRCLKIKNLTTSWLLIAIAILEVYAMFTTEWRRGKPIKWKLHLWFTCTLFTVTAPILIGWYPCHSTENVQFQLSTHAWKLCMWRLFRLNEGCASFAWVSHIKCCKCRVVVMLCWHARVNITTRLTLLDLDPSPLIIIILYHMRQLQVTQNLPYIP